MTIAVGPVIYAIYVNETQIPDYALDVELRQEWGKHELFFVRIEYSRLYTGIPSLQFWADDAPVRIIWGRRPDNIQTWYGYVNHHTISSNADSGSKAFQVTYVLIGTSKPMNTDKTRTWGQVTGTYIAKAIASEYRLRTVLSTSDWLLPYEVQANESDFHFLNRIANKLGFRFWVSGATLYFIDPSIVISGAQQQSAPQFSLDKRFTQVDTIRDFQMTRGDNLPGATKSTRTAFGIDTNSGQVFKVTADSAQSSNITQTMTNWPFEDMRQASNTVNAWQQRSQFWISATAELFGNTFIYPGKLVSLSGLQLPTEGTGFWLVGCARHVLKVSGTTLTSSDKYVTQVELLRNQTAVAPKIKSVTQITPEFVPCKLFNGNWTSTDMSVLYDGTVSV